MSADVSAVVGLLCAATFAATALWVGVALALTRRSR